MVSITDNNRNNDTVPRLRSIASYRAFQPHALAIGFNTSAVAGPLGVAIFQTCKPHSPLLVFNHASPSSTTRPISSLEFQPTPSHLNHHINGTSSDIYNGYESNLLACARGNGVLIWDTSGHSLSPLLGRLTCDDNNNTNENTAIAINSYNDTISSSNTTVSIEYDFISSLKWKGTSSQSSSSYNYILTTSAQTVSQWDIRCWKPRMRPIIRFPFIPPSSSTPNNVRNRTAVNVSVVNHSSSNSSYSSYNNNKYSSAKFVHVACHNDPSISNTHFVAVMDSIGMVRIYDDRNSQKTYSEFWAHERVGIGIESIVLNNDTINRKQKLKKNDPNTEATKFTIEAEKGKVSSGWVTWGGGSYNNSNKCDTVRVWRDKQQDNNSSSKNKTMATTISMVNNNNQLPDSDSYWDMTSDHRFYSEAQNRESSSSYEIVATLGSSHTSCARVCPGSPFFTDGMIITIGPTEIEKEKMNTVITTPANIILGQSSGRNNHSYMEKNDKISSFGENSMNWEAKLYSMNSCFKPLNSKQHLEQQQQQQRQKDQMIPDCIATFRGGDTDVETLSQVLGQKCDMGHLIAAEVALGPSLSNKRDVELRLCCLTSTGYLLTYGIPEASTIGKSNASDDDDDDNNNNDISLPIQEDVTQNISSYHAIRPSRSLNKNNPRAVVFRRHSKESNSLSIDYKSVSSLTHTQVHESTVPQNEHHQQQQQQQQQQQKKQQQPKQYGSIQSDILPKLETNTSISLFRNQNQTQMTFSNFDASSHDDWNRKDIIEPSVVCSTDEEDIDKLLENEAIYSIANGVEGIMQFDMDFPLPYSNQTERNKNNGPIQATRMSTSINPPTAVAPNHHENLNIDRSIINRSRHQHLVGQKPIVPNAVNDRNKAINVPCPRLCGASFAIGQVSGILIFHNGSVSKMWSWYQKNERHHHHHPGPRNSGSSSSLMQHPPKHIHNLQQQQQHKLEVISEASLLSKNFTVSSNNNQMTTENSIEIEPALSRRALAMNRKYPRTFYDLMQMNSAAKTAQWGQEGVEGNDASDDESSDSNASSSSDTSSEVSDERERVILTPSESIVSGKKNDDEKKNKHSMYDDYFNTPSVLRVGNDIEEIPTSMTSAERSGSKLAYERKSTITSRKEIFFAADFVDPVVVFDTRHHTILMNGQCPELANLWHLGAWWLTSKGNIPDAEIVYQNHDRIDKGKTMLIDYNEALPQEGRSFGATKNMQMKLRLQKKSVSVLSADNREAYVPLSAKQASVIGNFRKLFQHQHEVSSTPPPDRSLDLRRVNSTNSIRKRILKLPTTYESSASSTALSGAQTSSTKQIGVFTIAPSSEISMSTLLQKQLCRTKKLCTLNAKSSRNLGQIEKADVWSMLAKMLDNCQRCSSDGYDGWGSMVDGALGRELVANMLRYYENLGDAQMLATIVCVLSGGEDRRRFKSKTEHATENIKDSSQRNWRLGSLLPDDVKKYDRYMYQYGTMLYRWGLLELRAELIKHMAYALPGAGGEQVIATFSEGDRKKNRNSSVVQNNGAARQMSFAALCPRCVQIIPPESNVCMICKDYGFRCSICSNAVRGLFTACMTCGHGGHLNHIMSWFDKHTFCPTGCGCRCIFNTFAPRENSEPVGSHLLQPTSTYSIPLPFTSRQFGSHTIPKAVGFRSGSTVDEAEDRFSKKRYVA